MRLYPLVCWMTAACALTLFGLHSAIAGEVVIVHVTDGRVLEAEVDSRTDDQQLWLRFTAPGIALSSAIAWEDVAVAWRGAQRLSASELRQQADTLKSELPEGFFSAVEADNSDLRRRDAKTSITGATEESNLRAETENHEVETLQVDARLANWDDDVEVDGLEVRISPLASDGRLTPVDGAVQIRLLGQRSRGIGRGPFFTELARQSCPVRSTDFTSGGAVYRLPFRTTHPDFDLDVTSQGLVHVRLTAPDQGFFEASTPVRTRLYSWLRDQLQLLKGTRFFPGEKTRR